MSSYGGRVSKLRDDFIEWQMNKVGTAFVEDEIFFRDRYGTHITPLTKDLFRELLETDARLAILEARAAAQDEEDDRPVQCCD
jgi:hypothetical protein